MDPIADFLTQIKNASQNRQEKIVLGYSKIKTAIAKILKDEGYIEDFKIISKKDRNQLSLWLAYLDKSPRISYLKRISKPGLRVYSSWKEIPSVLGGKGLIVISTPQGVVSGKEASRRRLGGEVICELY